jgi:hypothetical protein
MSQGDVNQFERILMESGPSIGPTPRTGFLENAIAAGSVFMNEETSISEFLQRGVYKERDDKLDQMIMGGQLPTSIYHQYRDQYGDIDYGRMAYDLKRQNYDVLDDYDLRNQIRQNLAIDRTYAQDIHQRATGAGTAGIFVGQLVAAQLDPINAAAMLIPGAAAIRTGTAIARAGQAAAWYGLTGAASETLIQPFVHDWKKQIGVEHNIGDSLINIGIAGIGSAVLGTGVQLTAETIQIGFKKVKSKVKARTDIKEDTKKHLLKEVEHAEKEFDAQVQAYRQYKIKQRIERLRAEQKALRERWKELKKEGEPEPQDIFDIEDEIKFLSAIEEGGPAPPIDVVDIETARLVRDAEEAAKLMDEVDRADGVFERMEEEVRRLESDTSYKFSKLKEHNTRMREDPVYRIDVLVSKFVDDNEIPPELSLAYRDTLDSVTDAEVDLLASYETGAEIVAELHEIGVNKGIIKTEPIGPQIVVDNTKPRYAELDTEVNEVVDQLEEVVDMEIEKIQEPDQTQLFSDFDEDEYLTMTPEQREQWLNDMMEAEGEEGWNLADQEIQIEEIDLDGNLMYESKSRADIKSEIDDNMDALDAFISCFRDVD